MLTTDSQGVGGKGPRAQRYNFSSKQVSLGEHLPLCKRE